MATRFWSSALIGVASLTSLMMFVWPLLISAKSADQTALAQAAFIGLMPVLLILVLVESGAGKLDSRRLAILGLLVALNAVIRLLGAGVSGIETAFFLIIIGAYVFGPSFGFILGSGSLFVSALLSAGVGPWLPFQMMAAGLVGIGAGLIGKASTGRPLLAVSIYGFVSAFVYGAMMTMWNWPFLAGLGSTVSYSPGGNLSENLGRFLRYELLTGGLAWDLGRAVTTVVLVAITGKTLLATLRRAANKAIVIPNV